MYVIYTACIFSDLIYLIYNMASLNNQFHVVEFEDGIQVIPDNWIQKDTNVGIPIIKQINISLKR